MPHRQKPVRMLTREELAVLRFVERARQRRLRVPLDYRFTQPAILRARDLPPPELVCDFAVVRALQGQGYLVWHEPYVALTREGKRALRLQRP